MRIGFVSIENAARPTRTSLHSFYEAKAFVDQGLDVRFLSPLVQRPSLGLILRRVFSRVILSRMMLPDRDPSVLKSYADQLKRQLAQTPVDILFSHGTIPISMLDCPIPIYFWSDATFAGMIDFYPGFTRLHARSILLGNRMEQEALTRSKMAFYSSEWAARTCLENYRVDTARIKVVGYGGNLDREKPVEEVRTAILARPTTTCRLVFSGMAWQRKGGDWAVRLAGELNRRGLPTELTLIGCRPPEKEPLPDYVRTAGYVDNSSAAGQREYEALLEQAHFLVLPTRADCSPRVIPEANAHGVPCLTTDVGGIPSMITPDVNGQMFPASDDFVPRAADYVLAKMDGRSGYRDLAMQTIQDHKSKHTWGNSVQKILEAFENPSK